MVAGSTLGTLVIAAAASLFMAWAIGAGSSGSTPFAPAVGANAISVMRAGFFVGILGLLGAVLQGANVTETVGSGLVLFPDGGGLSAIAATIALLTAAVLVATGVFTGYPIATAFTVTGAVVGVGLAMGGQPAWPKYQQIVALWVGTPFVGSGVAYATARLLRTENVRERLSIGGLAGLVGVLLANVEFTGLGPDGGPGALSVALARTFEGGTGGRALVSLVLGLLVATLVWYDIREHGERAQRRFLLVMGGLVAFSAGGSQVGLAIGPLLPLLDTFTVPIVAVLLGGGIGLLAGSWTGAPRMIKALSQDYSSLGPRRSIAALIPSFMIAQTAVFFGLPVSFNEIIVFSIIGSGAAAGGGSVSGEKMGKTVLAWVASLGLALGLGYGVFSAVAIL
ncbi:MULTISPECIES: inorganic phosphate transporter [Halomicrobium]|uniref:Phosphate transporter n=2 Tax=Halomicrobium mukohataei TaxID=57705 RepID=C7P0N2_HALMD|nr:MULTISPECIES: inorganic phosphate transporter [Halomicrobium]ACV47014.1 phosphate transporter [Halomicrobium mukohataei DSM 12286]QCD65506.1 inorganic phosphate transporter [Halomicrobium mukohataei]QFR20312.1 inorganic phosphate transporter [Halomicrobium sp. ZPS1]